MRRLFKRSFQTFALGALIASALYGQAPAQPAPPAGSEPEKSQEYQGPSILSRDKSLIGERGGKLIDFRFYGQLNGVYDSGLTPVISNGQGQLLNVGGDYGVEAGFGVVGSRRWKRDELSVDYHGTYRHYANNQYFDGVDQFLNLAYGRILTRRLNLDLKETVGTSSLANGGFSYLPLTNTDLFAVPTNELFDNRTNFVQSRVDLTWQKSARLSFGFGGEGFIVRRRSFALAGLDGYAARAGVSYRITRRQTVDLYYNLAHYDFQRTFGDSDLHIATLGWNLGLGRRWELGAKAGAGVVTTRGLTQVSIDPAIAAIVGRSVAVVQFDRTVVIPYLEARLARRFERSSLVFTADTGASPGNGVYLTSRQTSAGGNYSYTGLRRWSLGANAYYSDLSTVGQSLGKFRNYQGGVGATYKLANAMHMEFRYDYRHYTTQNDAFRKNSERISLGLAFSPGDLPLPIW
ncbi:MAG: hypothetical protein ACR2NN_16475 [Bryobacteraceae bacterium]